MWCGTQRPIKLARSYTGCQIRRIHGVARGGGGGSWYWRWKGMTYLATGGVLLTSLLTLGARRYWECGGRTPTVCSAWGSECAPTCRVGPILGRGVRETCLASATWWHHNVGNLRELRTRSEQIKKNENMKDYKNVNLQKLIVLEGFMQNGHYHRNQRIFLRRTSYVKIDFRHFLKNLKFCKVNRVFECLICELLPIW